ncbi:mitochondrial import inner membrane translocase subunit Tim10 B [Lampris incognitus]|uniref:mitochondrial import inner membrane translocase subunit Tim10 B n=1 Tax=Lampris incognitus TaxID=2546036 RepID=UPI0024B5E706|nr:mitochondrial import inner membrane translocase subunit Tim10 B [Lampris incognitus]
MEPDQLRNLRDFLLVYNRMTEICFQRCSSNFSYRNLTMDEERCVDNCAGKLIRSNHRLMGTYVQLMPKMVQRRMEEMESNAAENAKLAETAAADKADGSGMAVPVTTEGLSIDQPSVTSTPSSQTPSFISSAVTDVGPVQTSTESGQAIEKSAPSTPSLGLGEAMLRPEVPDSGLRPTALDIPVELSPSSSKFTVAPPVTKSQLVAATPITSPAEIINPLGLNTVVSRPSNTAVSPLESPPFPPTVQAGDPSKSGHSAPVPVQPMFTPSKPVTFSEDVSVPAVPAPAVSKPTESPTGQERP